MYKKTYLLTFQYITDIKILVLTAQQQFFIGKGRVQYTLLRNTADIRPKNPELSF